MSHQHTVIEPAAGLTVLVGPNNCGKSAIVTALQILCHNDNSTYVLRHGAKECQIIVETDDGHRIEWSRKKSGSPSYRIDGEEFDRLRGESGVWDQLKKTLRLPRIECDKNQFDVHIGEQRNPVFLLGDKGKGAAQFFASSSDAIRLVEMQDLHKSRVRENRKEHARLKQQQSQVAQALECLEPVVQFSDDLGVMEQRYKTLQSEESTIDALEKLLTNLTVKQRTVEELNAKSAVLKQLPEPPKYTDSAVLESQVQAISKTKKSIMISELLCAALEPLSQPPKFEDEQSLNFALESLKSERKSVDWLVQQKAALESLFEPPKEDLDSVVAIARTIEDLQGAQQSCLQVQGLVAQTQKQMSQVENEIEEWVAENPTCPTCGHDVDAEVMLSGGGHRHG